MSIRVMTWVWDHSRSRRNDRLVLLAIADCASDDGANAYPSMATLVRKTGLSERGVQGCIANLVRLGELVVQLNGGPRGCNRYRVVMATPANPAPPQDLHPPADSAGVEDATPAESAPHPRNPCGGTPADSADEPSFEPSLNHPPTPRSEPTVSADAGTGGGGEDRTPQPEPGPQDPVDALVVEIRAIRPEWTAGGIRSVLAEPRVQERSFEIAAEALRIVAADSRSTSPGRLRADGPWWSKAAATIRRRTQPTAPQTGAALRTVAAAYKRAAESDQATVAAARAAARAVAGSGRRQRPA